MESWIIAIIATAGTFGGIICLYIFFIIYIWFSKGYYEVTQDLTGQTVLITGANTGIGKETALQLAAKGAKVIIACRNLSKGQKAQEEILAQTGNSNVIVKKLDLCSFKSVRDLANDILETEPHIDILINNAGMNTSPDFKRTEDGFDETLQANHLGPFLLTLLLLELIKQSAPSRIINVASDATWFAAGNTKDLDLKPTWWSFITYSKTKTFNILFTTELAIRLKGMGVTANCCHPGLVQTEFLRPQGDTHHNFMNCLVSQFGKTKEEGAMTTLFLATSEKVKDINGKYFADCKQALAPPWATSKSRAKSLWQTSLKAVGLEEVHDFDAITVQKTRFCFKNRVS